MLRAARGPELLAAGYLAVLVVAAVIVPFLAGEAVTKQNLLLRNARPFFMDGSPYLLGGDQLGRDVALRLLASARVSLGVSFLVVLVAVPFGVLAGLAAGWSRGWFGDAVMRLTDVIISFPGLLLAIVVLYVLGPGLVAMIAVLAVARWPLFARVARAETLRIREYPYVEAARAAGFSDRKLVLTEVLPNMAIPILTLALLSVPQVMLAEAALSFLGIGIQPPDSSWGLMIAQGQEYIRSAWWLVVFPGLMVVLTTLALTIASGGILRSLGAPQELSGANPDA
jgi:peptide/nickel transport system permease protein